jgi:hypothetical protein
LADALACNTLANNDVAEEANDETVQGCFGVLIRLVGVMLLVVPGAVGDGIQGSVTAQGRTVFVPFETGPVISKASVSGDTATLALNFKHSSTFDATVYSAAGRAGAPKVVRTRPLGRHAAGAATV